MPTNETQPRYAGIFDSRKSWAIRHLPSLRYSQPTAINFIQQPLPPNITTVADRLQNLTLHPHPQRNEWVMGCLVCGKSYDQVIEKTVAADLNQTAPPGETVRESQVKIKAFFDGIQRGVFNFPPRECRRLPPVTASFTPLITMDKNWACRDTRCPYSKIRLTKLSLK